MINKKPVAVCTKCGHYTDNLSMINKSCPIKYIKKGKCKGIYRSMLSDNDWIECKNCKCSENVDDKKCSYCQNTSWICVREL